MGARKGRGKSGGEEGRGEDEEEEGIGWDEKGEERCQEGEGRGWGRGSMGR